MVASILQSGEVDGKALTSLADRQVVVLQSDPAGQWSTAIAPSGIVGSRSSCQEGPSLVGSRASRPSALGSTRLRSASPAN